jgi:hypothetical protein
VQSTTRRVSRFSLVKGAHRYLVQCGAGCEDDAIAQLMAWADDDDLDFDWFDAAVLARQITQRQFERTVGRPEGA